MTGVGSIQRTRRASGSTLPTPADPAALHHESAAPVEPVDDATRQPPPPRPAWPDRLPPQLEAAARRRAAFAPAPMLGDQLDKTA